MPSNDLWGDLPLTEKMRTPVGILREQAAIFDKKTNGLLLAHVNLETMGELFLINFYIVAPALNNYRYLVLDVEHEIKIYPLTLRHIAAEETFDCNNESEFEIQLNKILTSDIVRSVIIGLFAQVRG